MAKGKTKNRVKVALIGAGGMANMMHYPALAEMADVEMASICDLDEAKARGAAERFQIPSVFVDYREMLERIAPDAVYVLMPPHQLFDVSVDVLNRKHHLFIEKPPALNAFQNRQLARRAQQNGVIAMCGFQRRYVPIITEMRMRVEKHGALHTVVVTFVKCSYPMNGYYDGAIDILSCDAVHAVDMLRYLCGGDVVSIASDVRCLGNEEPNAAYSIMKFSSGCTGVLQTNWACGRRFFKVEMHALGASAYVEPDVGGVFYAGGNDQGETFEPAACAGGDSDWRRLGFYTENRHFIDCIKSGKAPESALSDTVKTMELVDAIYHSQIR